jgi:sodium/proline symporter
MNTKLITLSVFFVTIVLTLWLAVLAKRHATALPSEERLAGRSLNKYILGLSAGATGNSGFIMTGAVGLGYASGMQWLLLPLSWLIGDLIFWKLFPGRLNKVSRETSTANIPEFLSHGVNIFWQKIIRVTAGILLVIFVGIYIVSQWIAGGKFLSTYLSLESDLAIITVGAFVVGYTMIGGFRGSVYTDVLQAFLMIIITIIAIAGVVFASTEYYSIGWIKTNDVPETFYNLLGDMSWPQSCPIWKTPSSWKLRRTFIQFDQSCLTDNPA